MDFISETKFNAPIKGGLPSNAGNDKADLRIDSNLALEGNLCEEGSFSISEGIQVSGGVDCGGVTIGNFCGRGCGCHAPGTVAGSFADFNKGDFGELNICRATLYHICSFNELAVFDDIRLVAGAGTGQYDKNYWTLFNNDGTLRLSGSGSCGGEGGIEIDSRQRGVHIDDLRPDSIALNDERITSWSELTKYVGGGTETGNKIQRFTSPQLPADCSQFYFEGGGTITGTELPIIQVRETATGKLWQMDVWVNLDEACTGYTLGKPVAEVEPCSSVIEAGKWTAIVMS